MLSLALSCIRDGPKGLMHKDFVLRRLSKSYDPYAVCPLSGPHIIAAYSTQSLRHHVPIYCRTYLGLQGVPIL